MFGYTENELISKKAVFTAKEILQQPQTWAVTIAQLRSAWEPLQAFIAGAMEDPECRVILTGAGTSEYVGNALLPALLSPLGERVSSLGTTDIVASPKLFLPAERPVLLVSFARSGNSPESVGAVKAADRICGQVKHLFITCNADGALAKMAEGRTDCFSLVLAPETNDRSFAMTSSFTNMYLAALLAFSGAGAAKSDALAAAAAGAGEEPAAASAAAAAFDDVAGGMPLDRVIAAGAVFGTSGYEAIRQFLRENDFDRIVYLGSDSLKGIAQESALKILELTAGQVVALHDSPMGFRHGPKSVIDDRTVSVVFVSEDPVTRRYEMDLLAEIYRDRGDGKVIAVASVADEAVRANSDLVLAVPVGVPVDECSGTDGAPADGAPAAGDPADSPAGAGYVPNSLLALPYVMVAQTLALLCSLWLGVTPDNPCPTGEVNRVVRGVTIYED